jgi:hypothetical protein
VTPGKSGEPALVLTVKVAALAPAAIVTLAATMANKTARKDKGLSGTCGRESLRFDSFCFYFLYLSLYESSKRTSMPVPSRAFANI